MQPSQHIDSQKAQGGKVPPFFDLLSDADEIQVREIEGAADKNGRREFLVVLKARPREEEKRIEKLNGEFLPREYLLQNAQLLLESKDYLLARNLFSYQLKQNIRDQEALKGLGVCFFRLGDHVSARKCFRAFYDVFNEEEGLFWLGVSESSVGNDKQAAEYFDLIKHPEFLKSDLRFEFYREAGNVYARLNHQEKAEQSYKAAIQLDPASDTIYVNLGTLSLQKRLFEAAHTHFVKALSLNKYNAKAHSGLGLAALELGQTVFAERQFEKALELDSQNMVALSQLMKLAEGDAKTRRLMMKMQTYIEKNKKNTDVKYMHAVCQFKLGAYQACQSEVEALLKDAKDHVPSQRLREELIKHLQSSGGIK